MLQCSIVNLGMNNSLELSTRNYKSVKVLPSSDHIRTKHQTNWRKFLRVFEAFLNSVEEVEIRYCMVLSHSFTLVRICWCSNATNRCDGMWPVRRLSNVCWVKVPSVLIFNVCCYTSVIWVHITTPVDCPCFSAYSGIFKSQGEANRI